MSEENTNGTVPAKEKSTIIDDLHKEFLARKTPVTAKEAKALLDTWTKAHQARIAAERAFDEAQQAETEASKAVVRARGKGRFVTPDGTPLLPMARGKTVFLRNDSTKDLPSFG